jgi:hypothetical protein
MTEEESNCTLILLFFFIVSSVIDRGFEPQSGQTKDYKVKIDRCSFFAKHTVIRSNSKNWVAQI